MPYRRAKSTCKTNNSPLNKKVRSISLNRSLTFLKPGRGVPGCRKEPKGNQATFEPTETAPSAAQGAVKFASVDVGQY